MTNKDTKDKEKDKIKELVNLYQEKYAKAYFKIAKHVDNDMLFHDILFTNMNMPESYNDIDVRNIFLLNTYDKNKLIAYDKNLPDEINLYEYYYNFENLSENFFENNEIFANADQIKGFTRGFLSKFFQNRGYNFFDKIVINTLIKSKILIRHDSAQEHIENTFMAFNFC